MLNCLCLESGESIEDEVALKGDDKAGDNILEFLKVEIGAFGVFIFEKKFVSVALFQIQSVLINKRLDKQFCFCK